MHKFSRLVVTAAAIATLVPMTVTATAAVDTTPPVWKKLPTSSLPVGATLGPAGSWDDSCTYISMPVTVTWRASDPESGIDHYTYGIEVDPAASSGPDTTAKLSAWVNDNSCGGGGANIDFYATNGAGLISPPLVWRADALAVVQDDGDWWPIGGFKEEPGPQDPRLSYTGAWSTSACNCWTDGTTRKTTKSTATVTLSIPDSYGGTHGVGIVMAKGPDRGKAAIFLDGVRVATVDTYSATKVNRTIVWRQALTAGDHSLKVVNLATSGRPRIDVDAFVLLAKITTYTPQP